jgi:hypothetical protein
MVALQQAEVRSVRHSPEGRMFFPRRRAKGEGLAALQCMAEAMLRDLAFAYHAARSVRQSLTEK